MQRFRLLLLLCHILILKGFTWLLRSSRKGIITGTRGEYAQRSQLLLLRSISRRFGLRKSRGKQACCVSAAVPLQSLHTGTAVGRTSDGKYDLSILDLAENRSRAACISEIRSSSIAVTRETNKPMEPGSSGKAEQAAVLNLQALREFSNGCSGARA